MRPDLAKLRRLLGASTQGEWVVERADWQRLIMLLGSGPQRTIAQVGLNCALGHNGDADANLIVAMQAALPWLLDEVERLAERVSELEADNRYSMGRIEQAEAMASAAYVVTSSVFTSSHLHGQVDGIVDLVLAWRRYRGLSVDPDALLAGAGDAGDAGAERERTETT